MLMTKEKNKILFISNNYLKNINTFSIPEGIEKFDIDLTKYTNINKLVIPSTLSEMIVPRSLPSSISDIEVNEGNTKFEVSDKYKILYTKDTKIMNICFSKEENIDLKNTTPKLDIKELYDSAFWLATNAKKIILPDSLETIQDFVFQNCGNIQKIEIGENVSKINSLFKYMNYSGNVVIDGKNNYYKIENNVLYSKDKTTLCAVLYNINGKFEIENGVKKIENSAFHNQNGLTQIDIPNTVEEIGRSFAYCSGLTKINISTSVKTISSNCFDRCSNLLNININKKEGSITGAPWGAPKGMKVVNWNG